MNRAPETPEACTFAGHDLTIQTSRLTLRPTAVDDFVVALKHYEADPDLREGMEGNRDALISRDYLERAADYMARRGWLFTIVDRATQRPVSEVCLEWMNLTRAQVRPGERVMRTPVAIWSREHRGKGHGREEIAALMRYAFDCMCIDRLCAMDVSLKNRRSLQLFLSLGYRIAREVDGRADLEITRQEWLGPVDSGAQPVGAVR